MRVWEGMKRAKIPGEIGGREGAAGIITKGASPRPRVFPLITIFRNAGDRTVHNFSNLRAG